MFTISKILTTDAENDQDRWKNKRRFTPVTPYLELFGFSAGLRRIRLNTSSTSIHTNSLEIKIKVCASTFNSVFFVLLKKSEETLKKVATILIVCYVKCVKF